MCIMYKGPGQKTRETWSQWARIFKKSPGRKTREIK